MLVSCVVWDKACSVRHCPLEDLHNKWEKKKKKKNLEQQQKTTTPSCRAAEPPASPSDGLERHAHGVAVQVHALQPRADADLPHPLPQRLQRAAGCAHRLGENSRCWAGHFPRVPRVPQVQGAVVVWTVGTAFSIMRMDVNVFYMLTEFSFK